MTTTLHPNWIEPVLCSTAHIAQNFFPLPSCNLYMQFMCSPHFYRVPHRVVLANFPFIQNCNHFKQLNFEVQWSLTIFLLMNWTGTATLQSEIYRQNQLLCGFACLTSLDIFQLLHLCCDLWWLRPVQNQWCSLCHWATVLEERNFDPAT